MLINEYIISHNLISFSHLILLSNVNCLTPCYELKKTAHRPYNLVANSLTLFQIVSVPHDKEGTVPQPVKTCYHILHCYLLNNNY